jgi:GDP-D-mannose dehydratase
MRLLNTTSGNLVVDNILHQTGVKMFLHYGDLSDSTNLFHIIAEVRPHEVYNLGAMSHVAVSIEFFHQSIVKHCMLPGVFRDVRIYR